MSSPRLGRVLAVALVLVAAVAVSLPGPARSAPRAALATDAEFYRVPSDLSAFRLGDVIRARPVRITALQLVPMRVDAVQLMYRTTTLAGPDAAVTTVLKATGARPTAQPDSRTRFAARDRTDHGVSRGVRVVEIPNGVGAGADHRM